MFVCLHYTFLSALKMALSEVFAPAFTLELIRYCRWQVYRIGKEREKLVPKKRILVRLGSWNEYAFIVSFMVSLQLTRPLSP